MCIYFSKHLTDPVTDSHDYPKDHSYLIFSTSEDCPKAVTSAVENCVSFFTGSTIHDMLGSIENVITDTIVDPNDTSSPLDDGLGFSDEDLVSEYGDSDWEAQEAADFLPVGIENEQVIREKIRRDLLAAKNAGFKVGHLGSLQGDIIVSVSCRIAKLRISEEAMDAWNVRPSEYLVLLIRYRPTYLDLETIFEAARESKPTFVQMHVGLCDSYKPSLEYALEAIESTHAQTAKHTNTDSHNTLAGHPMRPLFIGRSINSLLKERLLKIIGLRVQHGLSWTGAELYFHTNQGKILVDFDTISDEYRQPDSWATSTPTFLAADHMVEMDQNMNVLSLPLLAMQFTLRHFVKCTEFCLVCHCKTGDTFEALKPYVCSSGLCLYQYMAMDMGPGLEYEICSQPFVVDLLISLAYARATSMLLEDFPTGLALRVPAEMLSRKDPKSGPLLVGRLTASKLDLYTDKPPQVKEGDWIAIVRPEASTDKDLWRENWHCRVDQVGESSNHIRISLPIALGRQIQATDLIDQPQKVNFVIYNTNFDDLPAPQKQAMISVLLSSLPEIEDMKAFIGEYGKERLLSSWKEMISPAALDLLRWIVASNRSFIRMDNKETRHQVRGMEDYVQFRLVQGAADKEQRFVDAVNSVSMKTKPKHPTLFAWHGSPVHNWHSILREGLHFKRVINGRSCGNGVYMSNTFHTSLGYTNRHTSGTWPQNRMDIMTVVSLNEVVNSPNDFVSQTPHYVVQNLDWIQPRYLFVKLISPSEGSKSTSKPSNTNQTGSFIYKQDPRCRVHGPDGTLIRIPISALSGHRGRTFQVATEKPNTPVVIDFAAPPKRRKFLLGHTQNHPIDVDGNENNNNNDSNDNNDNNDTNDTKDSYNNDNDDNDSIETDIEDITILLSDDEMQDTPTGSSQASSTPVDPKTDFRPGTLTEETLSLLNPPQYATMPATKMLQQHLNATIKVQGQVPLSELGWYVDVNLITTVYQWIVELHTFDPGLPLAKDLKAANLKSIVLELRFPPQFPMDPPFVRVIRPRFLEFAAGGGGHVTAGGAMCMELLTHSGWLPSASIESVLLQVRMALTATDPKPARLLLGSSKTDYSVGEAVAAYTRACRAHGWKVSSDLQRIAW
jgi:ubiquitin-conjugating enzyme E2 Q